MNKKNKNNLPKVILMTQTRTNKYKNLDIWKSFVNYKKNNFLETEFIINHQKKSPIKTYKIEKFMII